MTGLDFSIIVVMAVAGICFVVTAVFICLFTMSQTNKEAKATAVIALICFTLTGIFALCTFSLINTKEHLQDLESELATLQAKPEYENLGKIKEIWQRMVDDEYKRKIDNMLGKLNLDKVEFEKIELKFKPEYIDPEQLDTGAQMFDTFLNNYVKIPPAE